MTKQEFIDSIATAAKKYASSYGIEVISPIIAQAILESAWGTSFKAKYHNYFGLKYRKNRVTCNNGYFEDDGSEQNANGTYTNLPITTAWYAFDSLDLGVKGYFEFINIANYANLKGVTDAKVYLENIKADGYATSLKYVDNVYAVITANNLLQYDDKSNEEKEEYKVSNSSLVSFTKISPNKSSPRNHAIDTITIHCVVGQASVESLGNVFATKERKASSNYGIGFDGRIGMYCEEKDRSWCTSSSSNDNRAITIEVASDTTHPYAVNDKAFNSLIKLCADICKRNGIKELKWKADKNLIGQVDKQNMSVHRWFANKSCPGEYLYSRHGLIVDEVNKLIKPATKPKQQKPGVLYRVQTGAFSNKANADALLTKVKAKGFDTYMIQDGGLYKVQVGAYSNKANANAQAAKLKAAGFDTYITTKSGAAVSNGVNKKSVSEIAREVIAGKWGNGVERTNKLKAAGYNSATIQNEVNKLLKK